MNLLEAKLLAAVAAAIGPFPRIEYSTFASRGVGWYVETRRVGRRSYWQGPYETFELAQIARGGE
jgi:hypothetical protein